MKQIDIGKCREIIKKADLNIEGECLEEALDQLEVLQSSPLYAAQFIQNINHTQLIPVDKTTEEFSDQFIMSASMMVGKFLAEHQGEMIVPELKMEVENGSRLLTGNRSIKGNINFYRLIRVNGEEEQ